MRRDPKQSELNIFAAARHWTPRPFRSWEAFGFTVSVSLGRFVASRNGEREFFDDLGELERHIAYVHVTGQAPAR